MTRQRGVAAGLFTVVIFAVLGVIAYSSYQSSANRQRVYVLRHDVVAGSLIGEGDFTAVEVAADPDQFQTAESRAASSLIGRFRYLANLRRDDILRQDDTAVAAALVPVPVSIAIGAAGINIGDSIDIYADSNGSTLLVGQHLPVVALGSPLLVGVDPRSSAYWVALSFSTTRLAAVRADHAGPSRTVEVTTAQALCVLSAAIGCPAQTDPTR